MYDTDSSQNLKSALKPRHVQMMALGGVIGMGLFVGSSVVIQSAGPACNFVLPDYGSIDYFSHADAG